ncbi:MAG: VWA domain-containing protein, partial [Phycisphaeraceae bacterium]|nr:VWA domain-containing protein [Phycisphaeraceae bacterium]
MFADLPIQFEHPVMLLVLLLIVPVVLLARMGSAGQGRGKLIGSVVVRTILILLLAVSLARPSVVDRGESVTLMVVADVSRSIPRELQRESGRFLERVADAKRNEEDRIGVVTVAEESEIRQTPDMNAVIQLDHAGDLAATDLASAMRTAISLLPTDTANRILLVSDGNETESNLLEAVELARANDIPVDVLPIEYEYGSEIVFEQLRAPNRARLGQSVDLRAFLRSSSETSGVLRIFQNDALVDLDPGSTSDGIRIDLEPGSNTVSIPVTLESGGAQRFRAEFSPDDPDSDAILENNVYESVTFVASDGRALVIDEGGTETTALVSALRTG